MSARTPTITDTTYAKLMRGFRPAAYYFGRTWCPAVDTDGDGYSIRVLKSEVSRGGTTNTTYDYFYLDADGLITTSPRGYAKDFTKRVRVTDIAEVAKAQEAPDPTAPRMGLGF